MICLRGRNHKNRILPVGGIKETGRGDIDRAPSYGYWASQGKFYYGYKLHRLTGTSGVFHSYDITAANVHDLGYLNDVKLEYHDCDNIGDKD